MINRGGLTYPSDTWFQDFTSMSLMFDELYPPGKPLPAQEANFVKKFAKFLQSKFPNRDPQILNFVTVLKVKIRIKENNLAKAKTDLTLRGKIKLNEIAHQGD